MKKGIKNLIPSDVRTQLRNWQEQITLNIAHTLGKSALLSSAYYSLFNSPFRRETHGVMFGRQKYVEETRLPQTSQFLLRRNVHRLEKGLISRPRRTTFAVSYIEETVNAFVRTLEGNSDYIEASSELRWAHDVLEDYFEANASHPIIDKAKDTFEAAISSAKHESEEPEQRLAPYCRDLDSPNPVTYEAFMKLANRRRSVRWYEQRPVPRELIDQAIAAAALSPSACNRQPFEFRIFDDPKMIQRVSSIPGGTVGFNENFPVIVVLIGKLRAYFAERDRHLIYIDGSLAAMSFMFALETLGLSSCSINWPDVTDKERKMKAVLNLDPDERPIMLISLGYPDPKGMVPYSQKKPLNQLRTYNR